MAERRKIIWDFQANTRDFDRDVRGTERKLSGVQRASSGVQRGFGEISRAAAGVGVALGAAEIGQFALDAVRMADQAGVAAENLEQVLGPAADDLRARLDEARHTMGINSGEFDTMAARLALLMDGMGVAAEESSGYIGTLIERGGDLAAFQGRIGEAAGAVDAITAAVRGEFDALETWGVKISQSDIDKRIQEKIESGWDPHFASLDENEQKLIAIIELIEERGAAAIGELGEAAETTAGQTNEMNTKLDDLKIKLGEELQGPLENVLGMLTDLIDELSTLADESTPNAEKFKSAWQLALDLVIDRFGILRGVVGGVRRTVGNLWDDLKSLPGEGLEFVQDRLGGLVGAIPEFQSGGVVPGPPSQAQLAVVHGGETITPGGAPGPTVVVNMGVVGDPDAAAQAIVDLLDRYERVSGQRPSGLGYAG